MTADSLLSRLEALKIQFSDHAEAPFLALLDEIDGCVFEQPTQLIRLHEALLFARAYPVSTAVARRIDSCLGGFAARVAHLASPIDVEEPEVSGLAGSGLTAVFSRDMARYLVRRYPRQVSIHWDAWSTPERLYLVLPAMLPLLRDDAAVEAHVPYREWLEAAGGLKWLVERADAWDVLEIPLRVEFEDRMTRSLMRLDRAAPFCHCEPLIPRRDVSLLAAPATPLRRLAKSGGQRIINLARDASAVRYRELHGFTYGDPEHVYRASMGRGVVVFVWGVKPENRLPLRAYYAATLWKNSVPIGYFEALAIAERMEAGFNLYYTFREGETAWIYARLLKLFHDFLGVRTIVLDPYQIGHENEEAIASGAFWFYRKLGFRSVDPGVRELTAREERRIAGHPGYRTPAATLRKLVTRPMAFEYPGAEPGAWDQFETRRIGLASAKALRGDKVSDWDALRAVLPGYRRWTPAERSALVGVEVAKAGPEEREYLAKMRDHVKLRRGLLHLGCEDTARIPHWESRV